MNRRQANTATLVTGAILALAIGLGVGLLVTRVTGPPGGGSDAFANLGAEAREEYAVLVATGYTRDGDLVQARTRLERLALPNVQLWISHLTDRFLAEEPGTGRLKRATPIGITGPEGAGRKLSVMTGVPETRCIEAIQQGLLAGHDVEDPSTGFPIFAFRLRQFLSRGDTVYGSLEAPEERYITTNAQQFVPGDRERILLPLAFCMECGQEYYTVRKGADAETDEAIFTPPGADRPERRGRRGERVSVCQYSESLARVRGRDRAVAR